jgi:hypothetical protein
LILEEPTYSPLRVLVPDCIPQAWPFLTRISVMFIEKNDKELVRKRSNRKSSQAPVKIKKNKFQTSKHRMTNEINLQLQTIKEKNG